MKRALEYAGEALMIWGLALALAYPAIVGLVALYDWLGEIGVLATLIPFVVLAPLMIVVGAGLKIAGRIRRKRGAAHD